MKVGNQYIIPYKGLKEGNHTFSFQINEKFFEEYSVLNVSTGKLEAEVVLIKHSNFLELELGLSGTVELICDRCLENFDFPINYFGMLLVKFKEEEEEPDENVIFLHPNEDLLDLSQFLFDCIGLSIPIQKFHPEDNDGNPSCNSEMLNILYNHSHYNDESDEQEEQIDPRWSKLKDLLKDENKKQ